MKKKEDILVLDNGVAEDIDDISEDIDDIGADTDKILIQIAHTLKELNDNTKQTKSTKRWVIGLFALDKLIMCILMIVAFYVGVHVL